MVLAHNTATDATPTWVTIDEIGDLTVELSTAEAEVDLRISNFILNLPSKISGGINFNLANNATGTATDQHEVLRASFFARTQLQYASSDQAIATSGAQFFKAFCSVTNFSWAQPTQGLSDHDVNLSLAYNSGGVGGILVEPSWEETT